MCASRPNRVAHRPPDLTEFRSERSAAAENNHRLRVVMVHREGFLLTYVWHLTAFFDLVCPSRSPLWECWSYSDIARPSRMAAAREAVRIADWVMFCEATSKALPSHVQRWVESWRSQEHKTEPWIGYFSLTGNAAGSEDYAQACLRRLARKAKTGFVAVWDYLFGTQGSLPTANMVLKHAAAPVHKNLFRRNGKARRRSPSKKSP